jgi:hypothetical protein
MREEYLGHIETPALEGAAIGFHQYGLTDGGCGLALGNARRDSFHAKPLDTRRNRAGGNEHNLPPRRAKLGNLGGDHPQDAPVHPGFIRSGEDGTANLDDDTAAFQRGIFSSGFSRHV